MYEIKAIRTTPSDDQSHAHVDLVGYYSPHLENELVMIAIPRLLQKMAFGEKFAVQAGDEHAEITESTCPVCGFAPQLKTSADTSSDQKLLDLPEK